MARKTIPYLVEKRNADGTTRHYWQPAKLLRDAGWLPMRLSDVEAEAIAKAQLLNAELDAWRRGAPVVGVDPAGDGKRKGAPTAGTLGAMITAYKESRFWNDLAPRSRRDYGIYLDAIDAWAGDAPARSITPPLVQKFYQGMRSRIVARADGGTETVETPAKAAYAVRVLQALFKAGRLLGHVAGENPASKAGIGYQKARQSLLWTPAQVPHMAAAADALGWRSLGTAILLNEWIGQREEDVMGLPRAEAASGALCFRQGKRGRDVELPIHLVPHLVARLRAEDARQGAVVHPTQLLVREDTGKPWRDPQTGKFAEHTFRKAFAAVRRLAAAGDAEKGLAAMPDCAGLWFMELRHTAVTRLHEAGCDALAIAGITGHTEQGISAILDRHYLVRTRKSAERAFRARVAAEKNESGT